MELQEVVCHLPLAWVKRSEPDRYAYTVVTLKDCHLNLWSGHVYIFLLRPKVLPKNDMAPVLVGLGTHTARIVVSGGPLFLYIGSNILVMKERRAALSTSLEESKLTSIHYWSQPMSQCKSIRSLVIVRRCICGSNTWGTRYASEAPLTNNPRWGSVRQPFQCLLQHCKHGTEGRSKCLCIHLPS